MTTLTSVPDPEDPAAWLSLPELAERIAEDPRKVRQLVKEKRLVTVRKAGDDLVPAAFVTDGQLLRGLGPVTTLLLDAGYGVDECLRWLFTVNDNLDASPVQALAEGRPKEVTRLAQTLGF